MQKEWENAFGGETFGLFARYVVNVGHPTQTSSRNKKNANITGCPTNVDHFYVAPPT